MSNQLKVTVKDLRAAGICPDARKHFFERHGLDWRRFVREGMTPDELRASGDRLTQIDQLEALARARAEREGN